MSLRPEPANRTFFPIKFSIDGTPKTIYPTTCNPFYWINWVYYFQNRHIYPPPPKPTPPNGLWSYYYLSNIVDNAISASVSINIDPELLMRKDVYVYVYSPAGYAGYTDNNIASGMGNGVGGGGGGGSGCVYSFMIAKNSKLSNHQVLINYELQNTTTGQGVYISYTQNKNNINYFIGYGLNGFPGAPLNSDGQGGNGGDGGVGGAGGGGGTGGDSSPPYSWGTCGSIGFYEQSTYNIPNITTVNQNYNNSSGNTQTIYGGYMKIKFPDGLTCIPITSGCGAISNTGWNIPPPPCGSSGSATSGSPLNGFILVMYEEL